MNTAIVNEVIGTAWVRHTNGHLIQIQPGMPIPELATVITESGAQVVLNVDEAPAAIIGEDSEFTLRADVFEVQVQLNVEEAEQLLMAFEEEAIFEKLEKCDEAVIENNHNTGISFTRLANTVETTEPLALHYPDSDEAFEPEAMDEHFPLVTSALHDSIGMLFHENDKTIGRKANSPHLFTILNYVKDAYFTPCTFRANIRRSATFSFSNTALK